MKKLNRISAAALAAIMLTAGFAGCGKKDTGNENADGGEIKLKWVMSGSGEQSDSQTVWQEFNKELKTYEGMENVSVEFKIIPYADYTQKFLLMQTSKEHFDIAQTYQLKEVNEVRNGTFIELDDLIDKEAPELKKDLP